MGVPRHGILFSSLESQIMRNVYALFSLIAVCVAGLTAQVDKGAETKWEELKGETASAEMCVKFNTGWIDLAEVVNFEKGDRLRITVGGPAVKVLVRLLPKGGGRGEETGVIGPFDVPEAGRVVEVTVNEKRENIAQIYVHGGPNPWNHWPLGEKNGYPTLVKIERVVR